jgi:flavin reductase (DIM6/NTAB) family NADH-FMN oxidoreductase RutF
MKIHAEDLSMSEAYRLLISIVVPRPIALVSTQSPEGVRNLAPFSFFNAVCSTPPVVSLALVRRDGAKKDTLRNIEATAEFVVNIVEEAIAEKMNLTSGDYPAESDEFALSGLTPAPAAKVKPPLVAESPVSLECRSFEILEVGRPPGNSSLVLGEVVLFHVRDGLFVDGRVDRTKLLTFGRLGGDWYARTRDQFEMKRPKA